MYLHLITYENLPLCWNCGGRMKMVHIFESCAFYIRKLNKNAILHVLHIDFTTTNQPYSKVLI
ncbi:unnamed protein product [Nezara viridula]|uniref:Uncharacterized protein n=1 Tax=Nezara viridula TaxID=85310 RepID=A0A9P0H1G9_NEZVI|nr:unnamed protein product [Nezara viridula]